MKTLLVPQVALAALALAPTLFCQQSGGQAELARFTRPAAAPRVRLAQSDDPPKLGVMVSESEDGVTISDIIDDSLADRAGLQEGDILFKIGGQRVDEIGDIPEALSAANPGETVAITVIREGQGLVTLHGELQQSALHSDGDSFAPGPDGGFLGIEMGDSSDDGVTISRVIDNSAAWFAGLDDGDLLISVNGDSVNTPEEVAQAIGSRSAGEMVQLAYSRDGEQHEAQVRLGQRTEPIMNPQGNAFFRRFPGGQGFSFDGFKGNTPRPLFFGKNGHGNVFDHQGVVTDGKVIILGDDEDGDFNWEEDIDEWTDDGEHKIHLQIDGDDLKEFHGLKGLHQIDGIDLDQLMDGNSRRVEIKIKDGVMTIDRDGDVEVIELDGDNDDDAGDNDTVEGIGFFTPGPRSKVLHKTAACQAHAAECEAGAAECQAISASTVSLLPSSCSAQQGDDASAQCSATDGAEPSATGDSCCSQQDDTSADTVGSDSDSVS